MSQFRTEEKANPGAAGFTLLEVIVAFSILALSLGAIFYSFGSGANNLNHASRYTIATLIAESQLARIGVEFPYESSGGQGTLNDLYHWKSVVRPVEGTGGQRQSRAVGQLYEVAVTVEWTENGKTRSVDLKTFRLGSSAQ